MNLNSLRIPYPEDRVFGILFLVVLLVPLVFSVFNYESFEIIKFALLLLLVGAGLLAAVVKTSSWPKSLRGRRSFFLCLMAFWLWALITSLAAWDKNYSFFGFYPRFTSGFLFYTIWLLLIVLFCSIDAVKIRLLLKVTSLVGGLVALWGLLQSIGFGFYVQPTTDFFSRGVPSFLGNPNFAAMFVATALPVTLGFLYQAGNLKTKIYYSVNIFLELWALAIFSSRGALLALAVGLVVAVFLTVPFKRQGLKLLGSFLIVIILALVLGRGFLNFARPNTLQTTASSTDVNTQNRLGVWQLAVKATLLRPVLGVGPGNFQLMFEHDRESPLVVSGFFDDAHNLLLQLAVTGGLPQLGLFLLMLALAVINALKELKQKFNPQTIVVVSAMAVWLTAAFFNPVSIPCYVILAVLISACFTQPGLTLNRPRALVRKIIFILGIIFVIYGVLFTAAENLFFAGIKAYNKGNFKQSYKLINAAIVLNPVNRLYYVYATAGAIRSLKPPSTIDKLFKATAKFNSRRAFSYYQVASLNYLLLYQSQSLIYKDAIVSNMQKAIQLDPYSSANYFTLAQYEFIFQDYTAATADIKKTLALSSGNFEAEILMAKIYQIQNNKTEFLNSLKLAIKSQSDNLELIKFEKAAEKSQDIRQLPFNIHLNVGRLE